MNFGKDFIWGAASSAYQTEGAATADGKGKSVWDVFSHKAGNIVNDRNADVSCEHYSRYAEDVKLMSEIGIKAYRFSTAWTRILPEGRGKIEHKGLDFYDRLTDELLKYGIEPYLNLYHWDLPQALHEKGGFLNGDIAEWFAEYAQAVTARLGDRIKNFMTLNEPQCFVNLGYKHGIHAPGLKLSEEELFKICCNVVKCHGRATDVIRKNVKNSVVSAACCAEDYYPARDDEKLNEAVKQFFFNPLSVTSLSWFADPVFLGKIPQELAEKYPESYGKITAEEMKSISQPLDYFGFNIYTAPAMDFGADGTLREVVPYEGYPVTAMNWQMNEKCMEYALDYISERYRMPIIISENGMANNDWICLDGKVHDELRIDYLKRHIGAIKKANSRGADVRGYFVWSFTDNFEWAAGFEKRFGLVYVDYNTQKRTVKESGWWYKNFIGEQNAK